MQIIHGYACLKLNYQYYKSHTKKWSQQLKKVSTLTGNNLKFDELLFLQAFHSLLEAHFQRSKFNPQVLCFFLRNLIYRRI